MQPANATESDANAALYLCVDIFLIFLFSHFPSTFSSRRRTHHFCFYFNLLWEQAQLKLLFINLATFTHSLKDFVACKRDFCFSSRFFGSPQENRIGAEKKIVCDSARCQRKTVWPLWKYFRAEIFPRTELRKKLSGGKSPPLSDFGCACIFGKRENRWRSSRRFCRLSSVSDRCVCKLQ